MAKKTKELTSPLHIALSADIAVVLAIHAPSETQGVAKQLVISTLQDKLARVNAHQSVEDLGLSAFAIDNDASDIELGIKDNLRTRGVLLEEPLKDLPATYGPRLDFLYPNYRASNPRSRSKLIRPPFSLLSPNPTTSPLLDLLRKYGALYPGVPEVISLIHLWTRAHGFHNFSSISIALMTIAFYQSAGLLPNLQEKSVIDALPPSDVWVKHLPEKESTRCDIRIGTSEPSDARYGVTLGTIFAEWFDFYYKFKLEEHIVSIHSGGLLARSDADSVSWPSTGFIVEDPFELSRSHIMINGKMWNRFKKRARETYIALNSGVPLHTIFDKKLLTPHMESPSLHPNIGTDIAAYAQGTRPPLPILAARLDIIARIESAIRTRFGRRYSVEIFGSTCYGVDSAASDLDLIILDPERKNGVEPEDEDELPAVYDMTQIRQTLLDCQFIKVSAITGAKVPIVKCIDPATRLAIDINTNERLGLYNTCMLTMYCNLSPVVRPLLLFVKCWAKSVGLNDPSGLNGPASFSSYCLTLMIIGYLQARGVLPNLQADSGEPNTTDGVWVEGRLWCDTRFAMPAQVANKEPPRALTIHEALLGWFKYWAEEHDYYRTAMSIRDGGIIRRRAPKYGAQKADLRKTSVAGAKTLEEISQKPEQGLIIEETHPSDVEDPHPATLLPNLSTSISGVEPDAWTGSAMVVPDPFILTKNVSFVRVQIVQQFRRECVRALWVLRAGRPVHNVLGKDGVKDYSIDTRNTHWISSQER